MGRRLYTWATEARARGDEAAGARFREQAAALLPSVTGESTALRRDYPALAGEIGWMAGLLDDELADMGRAVAWPDRDFDRWITGRGRPPMEAVINPLPAMDDDALTRRIHMGIGIVLGAAAGFAAWLATYWNDYAGTLANLAFYIVLGAAVLGHIAGAMRHTLWNALVAAIRYRLWWAGPV
ncbi:MAG TPA: hypothetical protein VE871_04985 [Longimicrobium sp.]|nr:hypothetical protein [Longimicrobium sp.]